MFSQDLLKGKTILVTGGGSGLGLAMARRFGELGAAVAICGRNEDKLKKAVAEIGAAGNPVAYAVCDVRDYEAVGAMYHTLQEELGEINGLVNNAAGNFYCASEDLTPGGFRAVVDIVLQGTFNCTQQLGKYLIEHKKPGSILNIVTTYTQTGSAFVLPSACAKAGVEAMTKTLAYEWAEYGIRVNGIAPGPFPTKGAWQRLMPSKDVEQMYLKRHPMHRFGNPEELANLAAFLMSDMAAYISGDVVVIDGAEHLQGGQFNFLTQLMPRQKLKAIFQAMHPKKKQG